MSKLIIISGLPGSGKSTLAEALARQLDAVILSVDPIESAIIRSGFPRTEETGLAAYYVAEDLAGEQLKVGKKVVIDAVSPVQEAWDQWSNLAKRHGVEMRVIECSLDPAIHKERIEKRTRKMHGIPETTWASVMEKKEGLVTWGGDKLVLDMAYHPEKNLEKVLGWMD